MDVTSAMEILAPAGGRPEMEAAVEAGANAVYFGLKRLNARQGAGNFTQDELPEAVAFLHSHNVRGYLTLNIDLSQREIGLAARCLEVAQSAGIDAVLIKDSALLPLIPLFPELEFHFSTQAAVSSSAGVLAAKALGIKRVVLARECSREEIEAASKISGMEIEVFVQGALCFSCSGRCLLSSWGGGRSGNRGACTSPCRVQWKLPNGTADRPLSMVDLCLADQIEQLAQCGVASLKIEGRLKSPDWVRQAVTLYRQAMEKSIEPEALQNTATNLGAYSGRRLSSAFFTKNRAQITGDFGRIASGDFSPQILRPKTSQTPPELQISIATDQRNSVLWAFTYNGLTETLRIPPQRIASPKRAISIGDISTECTAPLNGKLSVKLLISQELENQLLPRRCQKTVQDFLQDFLRRAEKQGEDTIRIPLRPEVSAFLDQKYSPCPENHYSFGDGPHRLRIGRDEIGWLRKFVQENPRCSVVLSSNIPEDIESEIALCQEFRENIIALALPAVIYEEQLPTCRKLLTFASGAGLTVEVNSWDTWQLAREAGVSMEAGPGMAVLNANGARFLEKCGCKLVAVSREIDSEQLEELCKKASTPLSLCVFARPALMQTRVELPTSFAPEQGAAFSDARGISLFPQRKGALTILRPTTPYDWRRLKNSAVQVACITVDLEGSPDPDKDLSDFTQKPFLFNYDRRLR